MAVLVLGWCCAGVLSLGMRAVKVRLRCFVCKQNKGLGGVLNLAIGRGSTATEISEFGAHSAAE